MTIKCHFCIIDFSPPLKKMKKWVFFPIKNNNICQYPDILQTLQCPAVKQLLKRIETIYNECFIVLSLPFMSYFFARRENSAQADLNITNYLACIRAKARKSLIYNLK